MSRKEIDALGKRLKKSTITPAVDLAALAMLQDEYQRASAPVGLVLAELVTAEGPSGAPALAVNSRTKTAGTIVDKIRHGTRLSTMQDVVGYRVSAVPGNVSWSLTDQNEFVAKVVTRFSAAKVIDRRARPTYGYRAVHVVIDSDGFPVEVQVRTYLQDRWANETEALGDTWGRGIRYGLPPSGATNEQIAARVRAVEANIVVSDKMYELEKAVDATRRILVGDFEGLGLMTEKDYRMAVEKRVAELLDPPNDALIAAVDEFVRLRQLVP